MTDQELADWIRSLITEREPESLRLDYKATLSLHKDKDKKELAKDVSSFANEQGGTLIYGIPEVIEDGLPRPKSLEECGMDMYPGLPENVENILLSTVQPPLHALTIRTVQLPEIAPKQLLVVHHPESYWKPHMIEGYGIRLYYRRGNFQCTPMNEREVEAAYLAREATCTHARDFFISGLFGVHYAQQLRAVACPVFPGRFKDRMLQPGFRNWLEVNRPTAESTPREGEWIPFVDGWRFLGKAEGEVNGKNYEIRVFHNGAVCLNMDMSKHTSSGTILMDSLRRDLLNLFARYTATVLDGLTLHCPVVCQTQIFYAEGLKATNDPKQHTLVQSIRHQLSEHQVAMIGRTMYRQVPEVPGQPYSESKDLSIDEETSTEELVERPDDFMDRLMVRLSAAFGLWGSDNNEA
ncbi:MAG: ATP-binding protein [Armatimonadetes bacterium]|nr:ATP-binding protein [Armatimonadota bacterium]